MIRYKKNLGNGKHAVTCPWESDHTTDSSRSGSIIEDGTGSSGRFGYTCLHDHCRDKTLRDVILFFKDRGSDLTKYGFGAKTSQQFQEEELNEHQDAKTEIETISTFLNSEDEPIDWIVRDLIAKGSTSFLVAQPKVGKSELTRDLVACVAQGSPFLGMECKKGSVLLVPLEEHRGVMREKLKKRGVNTSDPITIIKSVRNSTFLGDLEKIISELKPSLVIIDTFQRAVMSLDLNDYSKISNLCVPYNKLARKYGCHILFTHHANKYGGGGQTGILGSTALAGAVDMLMYIQKDAETLKRNFHTEPRYGVATKKTELIFDEQNGRFSLGKTIGQSAFDSVRTSVCNFLKSNLETKFEIKEIKSEVQCNNQTLGKVLDQLAGAGIILRFGTGKRNSPFEFQWAPDDNQPWDIHVN